MAESSEVFIQGQTRDGKTFLEPMPWDFVMNFARDNDLVVIEHPDLGVP